MLNEMCDHLVEGCVFTTSCHPFKGIGKREWDGVGNPIPHNSQ
jgi:hypothetical protein